MSIEEGRHLLSGDFSSRSERPIAIAGDDPAMVHPVDLVDERVGAGNVAVLGEGARARAEAQTGARDEQGEHEHECHHRPRPHTLPIDPPGRHL